MDGQVIEGKVEETVEAPKADPAVEQRARIQGWVPKEEFRGDEARWIPADEFVKRADHMMPILKSVNRKLEGQVSEMSRKLAETQDLMGKMVKINEKYSDSLYEQQVGDLKTKKRQAAQEGNWELYDRLEQQEGKLSRPEKVEVKPSEPSPGIHPDIAKWQEENSTWFGKDPELTEYAQFVGEQLKNNKSPLATPGNEYAFCQEVKRRIQATFPSKFQNPNRNRSMIDESDTRGSDTFTGNGKKTWNDLPDDAKRQCNKLMTEIKEYTKEKYLKDYFEGV